VDLIKNFKTTNTKWLIDIRQTKLTLLSVAEKVNFHFVPLL